MKLSIPGNKTILIADDDTNLRTFIKTVLERAGCRVIEACDGEEAIDKFLLNSSEVDLLVLDVRMPRKNGKDAYDEILKLKPGIKAIFISGFPDDSIREHADFISKPFTPQALLTHMNGMFN
ncbi:MAG TPA: response regulator [Thermodesulfovibrionales bacterium]|nr:response regulator [Thermodesulfovibrionales bacterium]